MAIVRPFQAFRPLPHLAAAVASKPYDVLNSDEARIEAEGNPISFLHVGKPEIDLDPSIHLYDPRVYEQGRFNLQKLISDGVLVQDSTPKLYLYAQTMNGHVQYGLVGCVSVTEYLNDTIKKHELTRRDKEDDRTMHVRITNAHSGPIFLTYRADREIDGAVERIAAGFPVYDFVAADSVRHQVWTIDDQETIERLSSQFARIPSLYVADGHHRSASAARVGKERADANPHHRGDEEYNFFLAVLFPHNQLRIMDYNRVVRDLNGLTLESFMQSIGKQFSVTRIDERQHPRQKGEFAMYLDRTWYRLTASKEILDNPDPVEVLDVSILQQHLLHPILGIADPRTDKRIDFVGGIRGLAELERRVDSGEMQLAFALYPTSIEELIAIADAGKIMPPKSTWFEPKLRDGLLVHFLD